MSTNILIIFVHLIWCAIGFWSQLYWLTKRRDVYPSDVVLMFLFSVLGPFPFLFEWLLANKNTVVFKKRKS